MCLNHLATPLYCGSFLRREVYQPQSIVVCLAFTQLSPDQRYTPGRCFLIVTHALSLSMAQDPENKPFGTPDGIRTHTIRILSPLPLPIGIREHIHFVSSWERIQYITQLCIFAIYILHKIIGQFVSGFHQITQTLVPVSATQTIQHNHKQSTSGNIHQIFLYFLKMFLYKVLAYCLLIRYTMYTTKERIESYDKSNNQPRYKN